ncbi:E3 ubiquitin-protein ligase Topors [Mycena kentingensis (nom. inval.)]|nr:E3 ubiquitin-protein ligase Topors [Mycena kentingensis (nom. inval.)]
MSASGSRSPSPKRVKLDSPVVEAVQDGKGPTLEEEDEDRCSICLQSILDRTVIPVCSHEFCFDCLLVWTDQSRRCPLCSQAVGEFLIHKIRSRFDYQKHYLAPLASKSPIPVQAQTLPLRHHRPVRRRYYRDREWGRREPDENDEADRLDRSIIKRRWIYEHGLYAKHVASNAFTRYRPYPTPAQFAASNDQIARTIMFLRRELRVWVNLDVEFLTNFTISLMKAIDIRSESAVKLLAEFLDLDSPYREGERHVNAEHFAHEVYSFVRSPYKDLFVYDNVVQYDVPPETPPLPAEPPRTSRWHTESPEGRGRSRSRSRSASRVRSHSRSRYRDRRLDSGSDSGRRRSRSRSHSLKREQNGRRDDKGKGRARDVYYPRYERDWSRERERERSQRRRGRMESYRPQYRARSRGSSRSRSRSDDDARYRDAEPRRYPSDDEMSPDPEPELAAPTPPPLSAETEDATATPTEESCDVPAAAPSKEESSKEYLAPAPGRKPPRLRHKSLFESVQAHLAHPRSRARATSQFVPNEENNNEDDASFAIVEDDHQIEYEDEYARDESPPPSLLFRLSDPLTGVPLARRRVSDGDEIERSIPLPLISASPNSSNIPSNAKGSGRPRPRLSAPEIMAVTHARHVRLAFAAIAQSQATPVLRRENATSGSFGGNTSADANATREDGEEGPLSFRRAALLARLEEEKGKAREANVNANLETSAMDREGLAAEAGARAQTQTQTRAALLQRLVKERKVAKSSTATPEPAPTPMPTPHADSAAAAVEARLRRQAQLRVRLAAEKRKHARDS